MRRLTQDERGQLAMNLAFHVHLGGALATPRQLKMERARLLELADSALLSEASSAEARRAELRATVTEAMRHADEREDREAASRAGRISSQKSSEKRARVKARNERYLLERVRAIVNDRQQERLSAVRLAAMIGGADGQRKLGIHPPYSDSTLLAKVKQALQKVRSEK